MISDFSPIMRSESIRRDKARVGFGAAMGKIDPKELPNDFPFDEWSANAERYSRAWGLYEGVIFSEGTGEHDKLNKDVLKYPLAINIFRRIIQKRAYMLWGLLEEANASPVVARCTPYEAYGVSKKNDTPKSDTERREQIGREAERFINEVMEENNATTLFLELGIIQQVLGAAVVRIRWLPAQREDLQNSISLESVIPDFFYPVFDETNPDELLEAWVVKRIPKREARLKYGWDASKDGDPVYVEHWTKNLFEITLGNEPLIYEEDGQEYDYSASENPFGFVPFLYIPTERDGSPWGSSDILYTEQLVREYNSLMAYNGDIMAENAQSWIFTRNVNADGTIGTIDLGLPNLAVNLGVGTPIARGEPDAFRLDAPRLDSSNIQYLEWILEDIRRALFDPKVSDGEDEGSQRSGQTLLMRMWPFIAKMTAIRASWSSALRVLYRRLLIIASIKKIAGITSEHYWRMRYSTEFSPMLARDREIELSETLQSVGARMLSRESGNRRLNLSDDPAAEMKLIAMEEEKDAQAKAEFAEASISSESKGKTESIDGAKT